MQPGEQWAAAARPGLTPLNLSTRPLGYSFFLWLSSEQPGLVSPLLLLLSQALPCFTVPSFNKHTLKVIWIHIVKYFLHDVKDLHTTGWPKAAPLWPLVQGQ